MFRKTQAIQAAFDDLTAKHNELMAEIERCHHQPVLIDIQKEGRKLKFLFVRNGEMTVIECMGTWDDDLNGWKEKLLR